MAKKKKQKSGIFTKYDFVKPKCRVISEKSLTVPDLVLSMAEIYRKYAVTGDISALPGRVRPVYIDDGDEFDDSFESEEMTDSLLHAGDLRESAGKSYTKKTPAGPDEEDTTKEGGSEEDNSASDQKPSEEKSEDV